MNPICSFCGHQRSDGKGGVQCSVAYYEINDYGDHKRGATCQYDSTLQDQFVTEDRENTILVLSGRVKMFRDKVQEKESEISVLSERLTKV